MVNGSHSIEGEEGQERKPRPSTRKRPTKKAGKTRLTARKEARPRI